MVEFGLGVGGEIETEAAASRTSRNLITVTTEKLNSEDALARSSLSILIPAFNEHDTIVPLLQRVIDAEIDGVEREIVVIDDGSTDGTRQSLIQFAATRGDALPRLIVEKHPYNRGKGAAIRTALALAAGEYVVIQDADLEYDPHDIARLLATAESDQLDVVYGSRHLTPSARKHAEFAAYVGGRCLTLLTNALYDTELTDEPTCYKLLKRTLLLDLQLTCERFEFCPEVTGKLARRGIPIREIPISYEPRGNDQGKKIRFRDFVEGVWVLIRERVRPVPTRAP